MSNFSILPSLPEMYSHCKTNEDNDMTVFDFVTDHLLNLDGVFDKHEDGDEQKPHSPIHNHHISQISLFQFISPYSFKTTIICFFETKKLFFETNNLTISDFKSKVFRPPIVA